MTLPSFIHGLIHLKALPKGCVATMGSFDGVHLGHMALLEQVFESAASLNVPSVAMIFEPQPHEYFSKEQAPARLMRLREKVGALLGAGIDGVVCLKFDQALRSLSADAYIQRVLVHGLGVQHLVVGDDFRFGCDRSGDFTMLCQAGETWGFKVSDTQTLVSSHERISSTRIRELLGQDKFRQAESLLGRPFSVTGRIVYGKQLGRDLGVPTANVGLGRYRSPIKGVFLVESIVEQARYVGVANVGVRPTVGGRTKPILEVHLLNYSGGKDALYGLFMTTVFKHKIRDEQQFDSLADLKAQIHQDILAAEALQGQGFKP